MKILKKIEDRILPPPEERPINRLPVAEGVFIAIVVLFITYVINILADLLKTDKVDTIWEINVLRIGFLTIFLTIAGIWYGIHLKKARENSSFDRVKEVILRSNINDWVFRDEDGIYVYRKDTNITIRRERTEELEKFNEEWLNNFANSEGYKNHHFVYYSNTQLDRIYMVEVDGGRCTIPYPSNVDNSISKYEYKIGKIINDSFQSRRDNFTNFDWYLNKAKINIRED